MELLEGTNGIMVPLGGPMKPKHILIAILAGMIYYNRASIAGSVLSLDFAD